MRPIRSAKRRTIAIPIALALLTFASMPVSAATIQRTWSAAVGTSGSNGRVTLRAYTNGFGAISYSLRSLRANAVYRIEIRNGTCANLGTVVARPPSVRTSATGTVVRATVLYQLMMAQIWPAARKVSFAVRILSGTSIRCGGFTFPRATRVAVSGIGIDLPVIRGPAGYPPCRVAMYLASAAQPREPGVTFIYAHARTGMFLPLLTASKINGGASLIGRTVRVWTSDSYVSYYRITRVRRTTSTAGVSVLTSERLWLQTSTGPNRTYAKLIVEATRYRTLKTTHAASHPRARPVSC
jgi:hypothetical protein